MTCGRCGASLLRMETLRDFRLSRERYVFCCGHSAYGAPRGAVEHTPRETMDHGMGVCCVCGEPFTKRTRQARKCAACLSPVTRDYYASHGRVGG